VQQKVQQGGNKVATRGWAGDAPPWIIGLLDYWIIGLLDYWIIGLLDWWIDGLMDYWAKPAAVGR